VTGVQTYQGHFTTPASGTTAVSTVGFQPNAIIFWVSGTGSAANDTWENSIEDSVGFAAYDGTNYYNANAAYMSLYGTTGAAMVGSGYNATSCFYVYSTSGTCLVAGHVSSVSSSGFVITYDTAASGYTVFYQCIGGDCNKACIATVVADASASSPQTYQTVTLPNSISWTPSAVLFLSNANTNTGYTHGTTTAFSATTMFGAMDAAGNQNSSAPVSLGEPTTAATDTWRSMSNAHCLGASYSGSAIDGYFTYNAMGAGTFSINKAGANYASLWGSTTIYALCLYCTTANEILCGAFTANNTTTQTVTTGITTVNGALFHSDADTSYRATTGSRFIIGATDGTNDGCIAQTDQYNKTKNTGSNAYSIMETAKCILIANNDTKTTTSTATATFSGAGIAIAWSVGVTQDICYIAFGSGSVSPSWTETTVPTTTTASSTPTISSSSSLALPHYTA